MPLLQAFLGRKATALANEDETRLIHAPINGALLLADGASHHADRSAGAFV